MFALWPIAVLPPDHKVCAIVATITAFDAVPLVAPLVSLHQCPLHVTPCAAPRDCKIQLNRSGEVIHKEDRQETCDLGVVHGDDILWSDLQPH